MNLKELDTFSLNDAVRFHDELNPAIFDGDNMKPEVREQLLLIAEDFVDHLGINHLDIEDITISGSSAAYSYTPHSDIDLHIVVDMSKFKDDDVYRELFDAKKIIYNDQHSITIGGYDVELYVQDSNQPVISLGEYSVKDDKWIKLPRKRRAHLDQAATKLKYQKLYKVAEFAVKSNNIQKIQNALRTIKKYRQAGLDLHGEFGSENLAFKILRRKGIISELYKKLDELHSKKLSLPESKLLDKPEMSVAQLANKHKVSKGHIQAQLSKGIKVEMEHTSKYDVAKEIALDHLAEDPNYYTKLDDAELEEAYRKEPEGWLHYGLGYGGSRTGHQILPLWNQFENIYSPHKEGSCEHILQYMSFIARKDTWGLKDLTGSEIANAFAKMYQSNPKQELLKCNDITKHSFKTWDQVFSAIQQLKQNDWRETMSKSISECSGYIPSEKEKNDPRWERALSVDVGPDAIKKNAKAFGFKVSRAGIPPLLR